MKKKIILLLVLMTAMLSIFGTAKAEAKGIGIKGGWAMMRDDYETAQFDDTHTFGLFFDMGKFAFDNLSFRPGIDYIKLENDYAYRKIYGIHLDWYFHFMGQQKIAPFIGFGAALNIYKDKDSREDDSDAGLELFFGTDINLVGNVSLLIEGRYCFNDIANLDQNMWKVLGGIMFKF